MLAGLAFFEMLSQYPQSAFRGSAGVTRGSQQQFATQTLRVHLLGIDLLEVFLERQRLETFGLLFSAFSASGASRRPATSQASCAVHACYCTRAKPRLSPTSTSMAL